MAEERGGPPPARLDPDTWPPSRLARLREQFLAARKLVAHPPTLLEVDAFLDGEDVSDVERSALRQTLLGEPTVQFGPDGPVDPTMPATELIEPTHSGSGEPLRGMTLSFDAVPSGRPGSAGETVAATLDADVRMTDTFAVDSQGNPVGPRGTLGSHQADGDDPGATTDPDPANAPPAARKARGKSHRKPAELPGYAILEEIGRGGMGVVYKARHEKLERVVALKMVLAGAHASSDQLARFYTEAQAVAHLQDPGIVQIYEVGEHDGLPYFSLEFVTGGSLAQKIDGKPQPPREAAATVLALARSMAVAHENSIIHRDLKPANVLLTRDGRPKITDFGLAKKLEGDSEQTRTGAIMGTPSYMSPEQAWGLGKQVGPATDQYALGAILYEMLVGRPPFQGSTPLETLELVRKQDAVPPTRLQPKIPSDLETICLKALQKEIPKRFEDAGAMADDLQRFLEGRTIVARPVSSPERFWRWCLRNPKVAALAATVAFLMATIAVVSSVAAVRLNGLNSDLREAIKGERVAKHSAELASKAAIDEAKKARVAEAFARGEEAKAVEERKHTAKLGSDATTVANNANESVRILSVLAYDRLRNLFGSQPVIDELLQTAEERFERNTREVKRILDDLTQFIGETDKNLVTTNMRTLTGIYVRQGRLKEDMGRHDLARAYYQRAAAEADVLRSFAPESGQTWVALAVVQSTLGDFELNRNLDSKAAMRFYERSLDARREWFKREPENEDTKRGMANAVGALAKVWLRLGEQAKARALFQEELSFRAQLSPALNNQIEPRRETAGLERRLGDLSLALGEVEVARKHYEQALVTNEEVAEIDPDHKEANRDLLLDYDCLGTLALVYEKDPGRALDWYEKAMAGRVRFAEAEPESARAKADLATDRYYVGTALLRLGKRKEADENYRACRDIRVALAADPKTRVDEADLMLAQARCGEVDAAARVADDLSRRPPSDGRVYVAAAWGFALCAGALSDPPGRIEANGDTQPGPGRTPDVIRSALKRCWDQLRAKAFRKRAVEALRLAVKSGWKDLVALQTDPDLDAIHDDPDFLALIADAKKNAAR